MQTNSKSIGLKRTKVTRLEDLDAYDSLPQVLRDLMKQSHLNFSAHKAKILLDSFSLSGVHQIHVKAEIKERKNFSDNYQNKYGTPYPGAVSNFNPI